MRSIRTTIAMPFALAVALAVPSGTAAAAPTPFPGQLVVAAPLQAGRTNGLVASASGIAYAQWSLPTPTAFARTTGSATHDSLGLAQTVSLVGDQLVGWGYTSGLRLPELTAVSLSTGARQDLGVTESPYAYDVTDDTLDTLPRGTGTGWIDARLGVAGQADALVLTSTVGAPTREFPLPVAGTRLVSGVAADDHGLAATFAYGAGPDHGTGPGDYAHSAAYYLDFASGTWTAVNAAGDFSLSPGFLAWHVGGTLSRVPRSDPASAPEQRSIPSTTSAIAITDTASAWIDAPSRFVGGGPDTIATVPEPATSAAVTVAATAPAQDGFSLVALTGNDFATFTTGPAGFGVYRVTAGSAALGDPIDLVTGDAPPIDESTGQQSTIALDGSTATVSGLTLKGGVLSLGKTRVLHAPAGGVIDQVVTDGPRTAVVSTVNGKATLTITGATPRPWRIPVDGQFIALRMSGHRLTAFDEVRDDAAAFHGRTRMLDLNRYGSHWVTVPDISAVSDHWLAYQKNDGSVFLRDLSAPKVADKQLAPAGAPSDPRGDHGTISISGDWVTWTEWGFEDYSRVSHAYQLSTHRLVTLPFSDPVQSNGLVAYADLQHALHLYTLATGADVTVAGEGYAAGLSLSSTALSYVDLTGQAVVDPIASLVTAPPRAVAVSVPPTKAPFVATFESSRPLTAWTLQVRNAKGKVVFSSKGTAPDGWVRAAWGGRGAHGKKLPAGAYRWTVTGKGFGGSLVAGTGKGPVTGVVHL